MSRGASRRDPEPDDERVSFGVRRLIGVNVLGTLSPEALAELVRASMILGGGLIALVVWQAGAPLAELAERWMGGIDRFALRWGASMLHGRPNIAALMQARVGPRTREMTALLGLLGGLFGLLGGLGGGLIARSIRRALKLGVVGLGFGAVVAGGLCLLVAPIYLGLIIRTPDARIALAAQATIGAGAATACGAVAGAAARASGRDLLRLVTAAVLGACLGALLFGFVETSFFPFESELVLMPRSSLCRLVECVCITIVPAVCVALILGPPAVVATDGGPESEPAV